ANGFVVLKGSGAVSGERASAGNAPYISAQRKQLLSDGTLMPKDDHLEFRRDTEFSSPSTAGAVVHGGSVNGLLVWKSADGVTLKKMDET
ncbi:MAG: DUF4357 domain-containing protein, partial [Janthinobacterium lividum]